jgi:hypothetical protein
LIDRVLLSRFKADWFRLYWRTEWPDFGYALIKCVLNSLCVSVCLCERERERGGPKERYRFNEPASVWVLSASDCVASGHGGGGELACLPATKCHGSKSSEFLIYIRRCLPVAERIVFHFDVSRLTALGSSFVEDTHWYILKQYMTDLK